MTNQYAPSAGRSPASRAIPWLAAAGALALFGFTLNHWLSFLNMPEVAKASGLSWQSDVYYPAYHAVTWPLHFLPGKWIPLAMNLFSAICGAAALGLLARSVMLLPHDRTHDQREREKSGDSLLSIPLAWLPPLLAVMVCGMQLTFWEHSTNATPETFNLLLLAYAIRSILEYRVESLSSWLYRAAFCYGAAMPNDWLVVGLFPGFVIAVVWLRGLSFFNLRFLGRMLFFGLLGLSLYLLLPALASRADTDAIGFWPALKMNISWQKYVLVIFPKKMLVLMALYSLLPVLVLSIRWASYFGDSSPIGVALATAIFHLVHAAFLIVCLWVFLDPAFSPRNKNFDSFPFLLLYYFAALAVGYFAGYFLLVFRDVVVRGRHSSGIVRFLNKVSTSAVIVLTIAVPTALVVKNLPSIQSSNGGLLEDFARLAASNLPKSGVVLSDDPARSVLLRAWLIQADRTKDFIVADTYALKSPGYHHYARRQYGNRWPVNPDAFKGSFYDSAAVLDMIQKLVATADTYYLQPSFGIFFEYFYLEPHGLVYRMKKYDASMLVPPRLPVGLIAENEKFWTAAETAVFSKILKVTLPRDPQAQPTLRDLVVNNLYLTEAHGDEARGAGGFYSRPLNYWGVELQKNGDLDRSAAHFDMAQKLYPDNVVARLNLEYNKNFRAGKREPVEMPKDVEERFGRYRNWDEVLGANGPYDEPSLCYAQGYILMQQRLYRQAAQAFERVRSFAPDDLPSGLWLAQLNLIANRADKAIELAREIYEQPERFKANPTNRTDALCLLAKSLFRKDAGTEAENLLENAVHSATNDVYLLANVTAVYSENARYSNALINISRELALRPDDPASLLNRGYTQIHLNDCEGAIATMTHLLTIQTNSPDALLNRAIAALKCDKLDKAQKDYEKLQRDYPTVRQIPFGLHEIAYRRKDTNAAIRHCESYLSNSIPGSVETKFMEGRLRELRGVPPRKT